MNAIYDLWGKGETSTKTFHPLVAHLIDVGAVAEQLWDIALTQSTRKYLADSLSMAPQEARRALSFWASIHDIGKATPAFQVRLPFMAPKIRKQGLPFLDVDSEESYRHGVATARVAPLLLAETTGNIPLELSFDVSYAVGAHHGVWATERQANEIPENQIGSQEWWDVRCEIGVILRNIFLPPEHYPTEWLEERHNSALALIAGFVAVSDVVGSQEDFFPYTGRITNYEQYYIQASQQAKTSLKKLGWDKWSSSDLPIEFRELFEFETLRPTQRVAQNDIKQIEQPSIVIIEERTGGGKTEAGIFLSNYWAYTEQQQGWFIAMPTMSTANAMFERVKRILSDKGSDTPCTLSHSRARIYLGPEDGDDWFQKRAKNLLSPIGVGTIDQVLKGAMRGADFFLRMWGIFRKTLICDEVHAYDIYMDSLFYRLLRWLRAMESSVVILTATLPPSIKRHILYSYTGRKVDLSEREMLSYPAITYANSTEMVSIPLPVESKQTIKIEWEDSSKCVYDVCGDIVKYGGCAAVICNTVRAAQSTYRKVVSMYGDKIPEIILLHAKLPSGKRQKKEKRVLRLLGNDTSNRPKRAILIATQVAEQSLDFSVDTMITQVPPIDTLIQRMGRLHRHANDRPSVFATPTIHIVHPESFQSGGISFGQDVHVYNAHLLLKTYLIMRSRRSIIIPDDTPGLMKYVYDEMPTPPKDLSINDNLRAYWVSSYNKMRSRRRQLRAKAAETLIALPHESSFPYRSPEDKQQRFSTRYAIKSVRAICLHRIGGKIYLDQKGDHPYNAEAPLSERKVLSLLRNEVSIRHNEVVSLMENVSTPKKWERHPTLRYFKPLIFEHGVCEIEEGGKYSIRYSPDVGIEVVNSESV
jgi:CRISPR-associated endonuclease/helicase Cas3